MKSPSRQQQFKMLCLLSINQLSPPTNHQHPRFCINIAILEWKFAHSWSGQSKCSLISTAQTQAALHTRTHTQSQRLERRPCLGFLLLEQRFMVGGSCRESLRLNYTDWEHQMEEQLSRLWGRMMELRWVGKQGEEEWEPRMSPSSSTPPTCTLVLEHSVQRRIKWQRKSRVKGSSQRDLGEY